MTIPDGGGGEDLANGAFALAPGEVAELPVSAGAAGARLATPTGNERFLVVLASARLDDPTASGAYDVKVGPAPPAGPAPSVVTGCALTDAMWKDAMLPVENPPSGTGAKMGDTRTINVSVGNKFEAITAQVIATGQIAVVWADVTQAHPANLDMNFVSQFLADFENTIMPREREIFGMESDLDGDGHIQLVFTPLTYKTAVAFFTGCDLKPLAGCPTGNKGEYLYLTPPGSIQPPYNTPNAIKEILAHETSHLIHFNRKVLRNNLKDWADSSYMIEGMGALAQDVVGPQAGNLYVTQAGLDDVNDYSAGETVIDYIQYDPNFDGAYRGVSYLYARYLYDRGGGDMVQMDGTVKSTGGPAFLRALLDSPDPVATAVTTIGKEPLDAVTMDFFTALAMSNREDIGDARAVNGCFRYLPTVVDPITNTQRGANLFAKFHGMMMNGPAVQPLDQIDRSLLGGGVEIVEVDAAAGFAEMDLTVTADATLMPRVRVGRIK